MCRFISVLDTHGVIEQAHGFRSYKAALHWVRSRMLAPDFREDYDTAQVFDNGEPCLSGADTEAILSERGE